MNRIGIDVGGTNTDAVLSRRSASRGPATKSRLAEALGGRRSLDEADRIPAWQRRVA